MITRDKRWWVSRTTMKTTLGRETKELERILEILAAKLIVDFVHRSQGDGCERIKGF